MFRGGNLGKIRDFQNLNGNGNGAMSRNPSKDRVVAQRDEQSCEVKILERDDKTGEYKSLTDFRV